MPIDVAALFYTERQASERLGVNRATVRRWIAAGKLEAQKVGGVVLIERVAVEQIAAEVA